MKKNILTTAAVLLAAVGGTAAKQIGVVPRPLFMEVSDSEEFRLSESLALRVAVSELLPAARIFAGQLERIVSFEPDVVCGKPKKGAVNIALDRKLAAEEYRVEVSGQRIDLTAGSPRGAFHAMQTLRQIVACCAGEGETAIPALRIEDKPFFAYRGMMLDVCRHFRTVEEVKRYLDILSLHKVNTFHWHLTDDQGWRLEIDKYPRLTEIGTVRAQTVVGHARTSKEYDGKPYGKGMFYTADDVREVLRYAADRYIDVIPEIEMPGHALAALAAYPRLGCRGEGYAVSPTWGVFDDVFCAGNDRVFEFMEGVLDEVIALFPSEYIHIGGDECPKTRWKECPVCQKRIAEEGLEDEHELQSYFMKRIERFVNSRGRRIIGWEEILEGGISPTATVMSWKSPQAGIEAAKRGNKVIMVPSKFSYFDYYQSQDTEREPFAIGGYVPVSKVYGYDPYDQLDAGERKAILGVQANLWTEYISSMPHVEYMVLPRMAAMAENGWSYDRKDYDDFVRRMQSLRRIYDLCGFNYAKHIFIQN